MFSTFPYTMQKVSEYKLQRSVELKSISFAADLQTDECREQINGMKHLSEAISED